MILDNGAAEGFEYGPKTLHGMADQIQACEIVVPDALGDMATTVASIQAFKKYAQPSEYSYMAVLQGKDMGEVMWCLNFINDSKDARYISTIGIPRHLCETFGDRFRCTMAEFLIQEELHNKYQIHFLGAMAWLREVKALQEITKEYQAKSWRKPGFRGIDTSAPVYMGIMGKDITYDAWVSRPENFFDITWDRYEQVMANINTYLNWAGANEEITRAR